MSSTREIAEEVAREFARLRFVSVSADALLDLADAINAALRQREQEVRAEERERAAHIATRRIQTWRDEGRGAATDYRLRYRERADEAAEIAAAIRRDDTPQKGEQS